MSLWIYFFIFIGNVLDHIKTVISLIKGSKQLLGKLCGKKYSAYNSTIIFTIEELVYLALVWLSSLVTTAILTEMLIK